MRLVVLLFLGALSTNAAVAAPVEVRDLRVWAGPDSTRVVLDLSGPARYELFTLTGPERVVVDVKDARVDAGRLDVPDASGLVRAIRTGEQPDGTLRIVIDLAGQARANGFLTPPNEAYGHRLVIDLATEAAPRPVIAPHAPTGERDLVVAIDAGHGGEDPGAIGKYGTREKDVVLKVARQLADRINGEPGMRAVLTRSGDYFVPFRERLRRARAAQADLFVSIHADAFINRSVRGSSVYVLSTGRASSEAARWLADRENAADLVGGVSLDDKSDVLASVLLDLSQNAVISASRDAAGRVLSELDRIGELKKTEVQHASLIVLTSPDIPSMLIETAYISNPDEEKRLRDPGHQSRLASAIHSGLRRYFYDNPPPGTRVAQLAAAERGRSVPQVVAAGGT
ncbi:MAG: N-acetylmuramoyl-L-alanine amidase [Proteobacteria bacterium]|nr:N-acetylmuramoyl-L-alanine amidase [Pseudomonadota bacterium]